MLIAHVLVVSATAWAASGRDAGAARMLLGNVILIAAIVEGALLLGWRLTEVPKSQGLEFLLVSELGPPEILLGEAVVGP